MLLLWLSLTTSLRAIQFRGEPQYNRDIRPLLSDTCFACHGPDAAAREANLRLDLREAAIQSGAIVPGKPDESTFIQRIKATDEDQRMPPMDSHKVLTPQQIQMFVDWVAAGANYQQHWSFIAPTLPDLPEVRNKAWVRNALDRFVLARLEANGIEPSPEADIRVLIRRVCLDLTGLPPTPEEIDEVLADPAADRYEHYVDRLLLRDQWGEHRARYWLDYARYADTHGIHFDNYREIWAYRDWVIDAFNRNMPFDQFTIEQLAGDLLPGRTLEQQIATGFQRCNITTNEGGIIDEEYRVLYTRDRTETVAQVWMGLTAACAVCHDHKFDPLTTREFYSLSAFFNNTTQGPRDGNQKDPPPIVRVPARESRARYAELATLLAQGEQALAQHRDQAKEPFQAWLQSKSLSQELIWTEMPAQAALAWQIPFDDGVVSTLRILEGNRLRQIPLTANATAIAGQVSEQAWVNTDGNHPELPMLGDIERDKPFTVSSWVRRPKNGVTGALIAKMDEASAYRGWDFWLEGERVGMHLVHEWPGNAVKIVANKPLPAERWVHVAISYDGSSKGSGFKICIDGEIVGHSMQADSLSETVKTNFPLTIGRRSLRSTTPGVALQDLRFYQDALPLDQIQQIRTQSRSAYLAARGIDKRTPEETEELFQWYLSAKDTGYVTKAKELSQLRQERSEIEVKGTIAHVMEERPEPAKAFVLHRGEYDQRRDEVSPDTPAFLPPFSSELPKNRLGLANWLLSVEHPLMARVTVNRFWQEIFGQGLVLSSGDFGITGQLPSHPELLDYLALTFRQDHWDIKNFYRQMVTSATYRQVAQVTPQKLQLDPENHLYSRAARFRLDAEVVRDHALAASGLLSKKIGGPSVRPYQPKGVWEAVAMPESNTRVYKEDEGEGLYRRSLYTFWKRAAPPASLEILNAPNRETCTIRRERTNTPIQALVTLNDPQYVEAARMLAQRILTERKDEALDEMAKLQRLAVLLLARPLIPEEFGIVQQSLHDLRATYLVQVEQAKELISFGKTPPSPELDPSELAAWTMLANQLMNLDEVLCK